MSSKSSSSDRERAARERQARESGRSISHFSKEVAKKLVTPKRHKGVTPSKKA